MGLFLNLWLCQCVLYANFNILLSYFPPSVSVCVCVPAWLCVSLSVCVCPCLSVCVPVCLCVSLGAVA